ncbi:MAG: hypothetical protein H7Y18_06655 [Clostridiaceae bacterium]|nr:hypothetical protein [Clostridiaceae bacterium]
MKKRILALILISTLTLATGCSKFNNRRAEKTSDIKSTTSTTTSDVKVTKDNVKNLSEDDLLKIAEEATSDLDSLALEDEDLAELDSIINNVDLTTDIPTSVELKK